jgi:hypothetical protein
MKRSFVIICGLMLMQLLGRGVLQAQGQQGASTTIEKAVVATPGQGTTQSQPADGPSAVAPLLYEVSPEAMEALKNSVVAPGTEGGTPIEGKPEKEEEKGLPPSLGTNFAGISYTGWRPPDCAVAVGPNHVVEVVNSSLAIYNKNGTVARSEQTLESWFAPVSPGSFIFDPKVVYDQGGGRFIMLALAKDNATQVSYYLIAVSQSSNATGGWWLYKLNAKVDGSNNTAFWADFPGLGYDALGVYITSNQYSFANAFQYAKMRILNKAVLYAGGGLGWYDFWNWTNLDGTKVFTWKPAQTYGAAPAEYLLNTRSGGGTSVTLWAVTNPTGTPGLSRQTTYGIGSYTPPPNACQFGGANLIATGDCRTQDVAWRGGYLYTGFSQAYTPAGQPTGSALRLLKLNTAANLVTQNWIYYQSAAHFYYPAVTVNNVGVMYVAFNRSSCNSYVSVNAVTEVWVDPNYTTVKSGEGYYGQDRWGDYNGISPDPGGPVWVAAEYAKNSLVSWGTWLGWLIPQTPPVRVVVETVPPGRSFSVDGTTYASQQAFDWTPGSAHTIATTTPQSSGNLTRYLYQSWNDGGSISHVITPSGFSIYQANFTAQHWLTTQAGAGGTVSPPSGWYNQSQSVQISATPNSGFAFNGWTGSGSGSYTGSANPVNITMNGPITETAAFLGGGNLVSNPGFESGTAPWSFFTSGVGTFTTVSPGAVGAKAARVALTTAGENTQLSQWNLNLEANKVYRLKFRAKSSSAHDLAVCLHKHTTPYQSYGLFDYRVNLTTAWQQFTVSFVTGGFAGTVSDARLRFWMGPFVTNGDQYFIDDVILEKLASPVGTPPTIVVQPIPDTVVVGEQAWMNVTAYGTPPLSFQWQRNGVNIAGATSPTYQKPNITLADNGASFRCRVTGTSTIYSNPAILKVNTNVLRNNGFELGTFAWSLEKSGASNGSLTTVSPGAVGTKAAKVTITTVGTNIDLKQVGFPLVATGQYRLTFRAKSSTGKDMTVGVQKDVSPFTCYGLMGHRVNLTTAWATYTVAFNANGFAGTVTDGRFMFFFANDAAAGEVYYIDEVVLNYTTPIVAGLPRVTTQPVSQSALVGARPTFTVVATGTAPLTYQWQKRGVDIVGATAASYKIPAATLADNGAQYRCQVKNALGVSSSNHATLTVTLLQAKAGEDGKSITEGLPAEYRLTQNYPNPFNPATTIGFDLPEQSQVTVRIFNVLGEQVAVLGEGVFPAGSHQVLFDATDRPSGVYFCRIEAVGLGERGEKFQHAVKMMLVK